MNTFLPYQDFAKSAACLDRDRLGKQRVEVLQLLNALALPKGAKGGWINHPCVRMWKGYQPALISYGMAICNEWKSRSYQDTVLPKIEAFKEIKFRVEAPEELPPWIGREDFHSAHRSNLLRKDEMWYRAFGWIESTELPYIWPLTRYSFE